MPDAVESAVFAGGKPAWHGLGIVRLEEALNAEQALADAGLNWKVALKPVFIDGPEGERQEIDPMDIGTVSKAVVRDIDSRVLGLVGPRYVPVQNDEAFAFMDSLLEDQGGWHFETAGSLYKGAVVWALAKPPFKIEGISDGHGRHDDSAIEPYVLVTNRHDGQGALKAAVTPIRVVCANTLSAALWGAKQQVSIVHVGSLEQRMAEAQKVLGLAQNAKDALEARAVRMLKAKISDDRFAEMLDKLVPMPDDPALITAQRVNTARERIKALYQSDAADLGADPIRGTEWGVLNAVAAYSDHVVQNRGTWWGDENERRFERVMLDGDTLTIKAMALLPSAKEPAKA